eukprot:CAMPEP_0119268116 /NCGR_PEP_ID=MMETSP1329-20130426/6004_1 /TAXON_ID=114041 /ORGANISM="Genus nov. species nov., Strain RCC1024" /LENGTH=183 /DNA_ID=CAMNT_0007268071 /DNA_START=141 /DNA_END=689 /DNA_ORIENTATION=-
MGKHGKQLSKAAGRLKARAKTAKKAQKALAKPAKAPRPAPAPARPPKASKKALKDMDVDEFLAGGHLAEPAPADSSSGSADEAPAQPAAPSSDDDDSSSEAVGDHQAELDGLAETDPEFYKYLKENDEGLLAFGDDAPDAEASSDSSEELEEAPLGGSDDDEPEKTLSREDVEALTKELGANP